MARHCSTEVTPHKLVSSRYMLHGCGSGMDEEEAVTAVEDDEDDEDGAD